MSSRNFVKIKTPTNFHKNNLTTQYKGLLNSSIKLKSNINKYQNLLNKKKYILGRPNLYRSFISSSAPFNYYKNPADKSSYLISYNGGPQNQVFSLMNREDSKQVFFRNNKEMLFKRVKSCGCPTRQCMPQLPRNLSYLNNKMDNNNKTPFNFEKIQNLPQQPLSRNKPCFNGFRTAKTLRRSNDGKIIYTLKKFNEENNDFNKLKYEDNKGDEIFDKKKILLHNKYSSIYSFRPRINKIFHRTQIFDHCKPFLVDEFQEFPD